MVYFFESWIRPILLERAFKRILEVGASRGNHTSLLLSVEGANVTIVDPCIDADLVAEFGGRARVLRGLSLDVLPALTDTFDFIFIDGDHNWFTVYHELQMIEAKGLLRRCGMIFLHDISWPYGRRDMYYNPGNIPAEFRHDYAGKGMERGRTGLVENGGFNSGHLNAVREGGARNGVLTAVEDFVADSSNAWFILLDKREFGLGILFRRVGCCAVRSFWRLRWRMFRITHVGPGMQRAKRLMARIRGSRAARLLRSVVRSSVGR